LAGARLIFERAPREDEGKKKGRNSEKGIVSGRHGNPSGCVRIKGKTSGSGQHEGKKEIFV